MRFVECLHLPEGAIIHESKDWKALKQQLQSLSITSKPILNKYLQRQFHADTLCQVEIYGRLLCGLYVFLSKGRGKIE